jgi:DNA-binding GntR family transcriptional regulator
MGVSEPVVATALPRSLAELAWMALREEILTGRLAPGTPLRLRDLAARLGMSVIPVREALHRLHQEGLVSREAQKGAVVAPVSVQDMEDLYRVRIELEGLAIQLACEHFTADHHRRLSGILDAFVAAYEAGQVREGRELHRRFHLELYALAGSPTLDRLIPPLLDAAERYRVMSVADRGDPRQRRNEHQRILDACLSRDGARARRELAEHLTRTVEVVRAKLQAGSPPRTREGQA